MRSLFFIVMIVVTNLTQCMLIKSLGDIDKRLIARYTCLHHTKDIRMQFKRNHSKSWYDVVHDLPCIREYPCMQLRLLFTRDTKLMRDSTIQFLFAHSFLGYDALTEDIFNIIDAVEKEDGYIPENIITKTDNAVHVTLFTNSVDKNSHYFHKKTKSNRKYITCETILYYEHKEEVEELLKNRL